MSVVLAGGGTAGHIEPAVALADALRRAQPDVRITCLGTERGLETRLVPLRGYDLVLIPAVPLPRSLTPEMLSVPGRLADAVGAAATVLGRTRARVLVGFGGDGGPAAHPGAPRPPPPRVVHDASRPPATSPPPRSAPTPPPHAGPRHRHGHAAPQGDRRPGPAGAGGQGARPPRAAARPAGAAGHRRVAVRPLAEPGGAGRGRLDPRRGHPG